MTDSNPINIYPVLPSEEIIQNVNAFRLHKKIDYIRKEISVERNEFEWTYNKYNKIDVTLSIVEMMAEFVGVGVGVVGIVSLASVVAAPVGFVLEGLALGLGGTVTAMKYAQYKMSKKKKKHDEIWVLAESKLNTINNHVSKAIEDGSISQEKFALISEEREKYSKMKENIITKFTPKDAPPDVKAIVDKEKKEHVEKLLNLK